MSNPSEYAEYANTIELLCVQRGCNLTVYDDGDFSDDPFSFVARDYDLCVTLDSPPSFYSVRQRAQIKGLDDSIRSMTLKCNNWVHNENKGWNDIFQFTGSFVMLWYTLEA